MSSISSSLPDEPLCGGSSNSQEECLQGGGTVLGRDYLQPLKELQRKMLVEGRQVVDLSMVNPDLAPPRAVLDRLLESVTKTHNHRYSVSRGVRRLREAFASKYASRFSVNLNPESEVCVCLGSKDATYHALKSLIGVGDAVVVGAPSYPAHISAVTLAGGRVVPWEYPIDEQAVGRSLEALFSQSHAKVLLLNVPSNPAGVEVSRGWWRTVGEVCARYGVAIINDFVYGEMCFSGEAAASALGAREAGARCVEVYSLSKAYNVPGWRVGALLGDAEIVQSVARLKSHSDYGLFLPIQYAAAVALTSTPDLVRPTVTAYARRIKVLTEGLKRLGWEVVEPRAGACVWTRYPDSIVPADRQGQSVSVRVAQELLDQTGVLVTPGVVFGPAYDGFVRISAVVTEERMREVIAALSSMPVA